MRSLPLSLGIGSALPGLAFPPLPPPGAQLRLLLFQQLEQSQWLAPGEIRDAQQRQLAALLSHVRDTVPGYRDALDHAGLATGDVDLQRWQQLPLLTRRKLQSDGQHLISTALPQGHGGVVTQRTSGSTGEPVEVRRTALDQLFWEALALRDHAWYRRDLTGTLCAIRAGLPKPPERRDSRQWGPATNGLVATGPAHGLPIDQPLSEHVRWLCEIDPHYLLIYPSTLAALCDVIDRRRLPRLREIRCIGETLGADVRQRAMEHFGVPLVDAYSSNEVGHIALQCPQSGLYHIHAETVLVEVLDDRGLPCMPGDIGRVVVTPLHSFAQPLLRYELRDLAEVGPPCPCGRGLPTLTRVLGRYRNLVRLPDGSRHWPLVGFAAYRNIAPIRQYQIVQHSVDELEMRLVVDAPLTEAQTGELTALLRRRLRHDFAVRFVVHDDVLPAGPGGKFEEFVCAIDEAP